MPLSISRSSPLLVALVVGILTRPHNAAAQTADALSDLSLEELTSLDITSASKRSQPTSEVAGSVYVLTQDEIRRAGANSLAQALRLVPGLQVAQIDDHKWSIGARGFNGRFANKLLVLKDGRSIYTPTFGGVYWDTNDTFIDDVERIEVIRGPGGAMWGANAVNGVINIITKHAGQTDGLLINARSGTSDLTQVGARYGAGMQNDLQWRTYAHYTHGHGSARPTSIDRHAGSSTLLRSGLRTDMRLGSSSELSVTAEGYEGELRQLVTPTWTEIANPLIETRAEELDGVAGVASWSQTDADHSRLSARLAFAHDARSGSVYSERRDTSELELQHLLARQGSHLFTWGLSVHSSEDHIGRGTHAFASPAEARDTRYSAFGQEDFYFANDRGAVTLGAKFEHSSIAGSHLLPTLRLRYNTENAWSYWTAISKGVRSPSRGERDIELLTSAEASPIQVGQNQLPLPLLIWGSGNDRLKNEKLWAYEAGLRAAWSPRVVAELSFYYNDYEGIRGMSAGLPLCMPSATLLALQPHCMLSSSYFILPIQARNGGDTSTHGGELVTHFRPIPQWRITAGYAYFEKNVPASTVPDVLSGFDAEHLVSVQSLWAIGMAWDVGLTGRYVSEIAAMSIPAYTELDARIAWKAGKTWEVALIGRNLLHSKHQEFVSELADIPPLAIERSVLLQVRWSPL